MFPDTVEELFEECDDGDVLFYDYSDHTEDQMKEELNFLKEIKRLKESGKNVFVFQQEYVF
jgi:protein-tyrosine phosphatase